MQRRSDVPDDIVADEAGEHEGHEEEDERCRGNRGGCGGRKGVGVGGERRRLVCEPLGLVGELVLIHRYLSAITLPRREGIAGAPPPPLASAARL
jgi:hypothetical protein